MQPLASIFCLLETIRFAVHYEAAGKSLLRQEAGVKGQRRGDDRSAQVVPGALFTCCGMSGAVPWVAPVRPVSLASRGNPLGVGETMSNWLARQCPRLIPVGDDRRGWIRRRIMSVPGKKRFFRLLCGPCNRFNNNGLLV